ncbi:MAG: transposase [Acidobacteria bacterium]|nr:transposase [Acidobacteriota bacterium]
MSEDKYIGMDVHQASIVCAVHNRAGKCITHSIIETKAETVRDFLRGLSGTLHVTFEEGTQAHWLHDLIKPFVAELIVCNPRRNHLLKEGSKSDKVDASKLAELLRAGLVKPVYHGAPSIRPLKELAHAYAQLTQDRVRVMSRLKSIYRARAIPCAGSTPYSHARRSEWLSQLGEEAARARAKWLLAELDAINSVRREAHNRMLKEARPHPAFKRLVGVPGLGPIRVAQLIAAVGSPHRFRTKRQLRGLLRVGGRHEEQRRLSTGRGARRAPTARHADARVERAVQPPTQSGLQKRGAGSVEG